MTKYIALTALLVAATSTQAQQLPQQIQTLLSDPAAARAHWGIAVTTLTGTPIYSLNDAQLFQPASNAKLFTTAAAMALLTPDRTFETKVTGNFDPATGTIKGDLTLVGGGDANLDSNDVPYIAPSLRPKTPPPAPPPFRDLEDLAAKLVAKGVKSVTGNIIGDDTAFPYEPYPESWAADDIVWGYGAPISALTILDNQLRLTITPGKITGTPGHQTFPYATVALEQFNVPYYTVQAQVETRPAKSPDGVQVERLPGTRILRVFGSIAEDAHPDVEQIAIDDPAAFAALAFKQILAAHGITVAGSANANHRIPRDGQGFLAKLHAHGGQEDITVAGGFGGGSCLTPFTPPTLATHHSATVITDVTLTNKVSQNLHAELLLHQLGRVVFCGQGSTVEGARMVRAFLLHAGIQPDDFIFFDGSGLSAHDLVAPRATAKLLQYATTQPWFPQWRASLPIGGEDGSLASRFPKPPLKDHVFAKTGTLSEARALSGYLDCASGQTVIFSIMVNNHPPGSSADRETMDKIVAAIAANN